MPLCLVLIAAALAFLLAAPAPALAQAADKPRVILTQDGEVDDMDSFIRYLYYANEFDTEGIIYTSSRFHYQGNGTTVPPFRWTGLEWVDQYIDLYEQIRPNLVKHADGYPTADYLRSVYKVGNITTTGEMEQVTEGSEWIKKVILDDDPRPLYIQAWGGNNTTARALKSIEEQYKGTPAWEGIVAKINRKVTLYNILNQDGTLNGYIKPNWPGIKIIDNQSQFWSFAYQWVGRTPQPFQYVLRAPWMEQNLLLNTGPLMERYRTWRDNKPVPGDEPYNNWRPDLHPDREVHEFISEGDSPAFMFLFDFNGLRSSEDPTWGGWGGRFAPNATGWIDTADENPYSSSATNRRSYPQTRWFIDLQHDFATRVAWGVADEYAEANHPPVVSVAHKDLVVPPGQRVELGGSATDPDGDALTYNWWQYREPGTYPNAVTIENSGTPSASVVIPSDAQPGQTIHLIFDVKDDGTPMAPRYQRVVITVGQPVPGEVSATVPATLGLTLGAPATFGALTPGVSKDYTATMAADVVSTAGEAALTVADHDTTRTGRLVNGSFALASPLGVKADSAVGAGTGSFQAVGGAASPTSLLTYGAPVSRDPVTLTFRQSVAANEGLRTGTYSKTLTFTLSTTSP